MQTAQDIRSAYLKFFEERGHAVRPGAPLAPDDPTLLFSVAGMFLFGLMMRGRMFEPQSGDLFTTVVNYGGYIGDLASGALYFLATWLGYEQPILASPVADYGTKFLVCAGLLNILAMVDAYEIAVGDKP